MKSKIIYKNEQLELIDEFIDIGYMAENFDAVDLNGENYKVKRANENRNIQLFISFPNFEDFKEEIIYFDEFLSGAQIDIFTYVIFAKKFDISYTFKKLTPLFDENDEFGELYGTKIVSGCFEDKLTKSLFLIGKDGAIYYIDMPQDLEKSLDIEKIRTALNKTYQTYTGTGCH